MIVMKFGGTSVQDAQAIRRVMEIVSARLKQRPVVVVSALAKVTDSLVAMANAAASGNLVDALQSLSLLRERHDKTLREIASGPVLEDALAEQQRLLRSLEDLLRGVGALAELSPRSTDAVLAMGELLSSSIVAAAFNCNGVKAVRVDSRQCVVTDSVHTKAAPLMEETGRRVRAMVRPLVASGHLVVMPGFIGATTEGVPSTLGRGGSDFSASIIGASLRAKKIEIWTDVEGMMTTDPRICPDAERIEEIGFEEASELAYFGAKVLHPASLIPAVENNIPVYVLNSHNPESKGTRIQAKSPKCKTMFRAIAAKKGIHVVNVKSPRRLDACGFLRRLFEAFERNGVTADLVSTSEVSVSVAVDNAARLDRLVQELKQVGQVEVESGKAIVCLVGENVRGQVGMAANVFNTVANGNISLHMISQGASEINISFVIEEGEVVDAVNRLHQRFFPKESRNNAAEKRTRAKTLVRRRAMQPNERLEQAVIV